MGIIEATRILGAEIQKDERCIRFAKARLARALNRINVAKMK